MTHGQEPAVRVDRDLSADLHLFGGAELSALALLAKTEFLYFDQFRNGETVMRLGYLHIRWRNLRTFISLLRRDPCMLPVRQVDAGEVCRNAVE